MTLEESIKLITDGAGVQLYDIVTTNENNNKIFRIYITHKDGVSLDTCAQISQLVSPLLDIHTPLNGKYNLEVSSPGIERKLKTLNHFRCSIGEKVRIKEYSTQTLQGELIEVLDNGDIKIKDSDGDIHTINYDDVLSASTYFEWKK